MTTSGIVIHMKIFLVLYSCVFALADFAPAILLRKHPVVFVNRDAVASD